jgi:ComF family protein
MRFIQHLTRLVAPPVCVLCHGPGQHLDEPWGLDLCPYCEAACIPAGSGDVPFAGAFCLFLYQDPVDLMIQQLKFHRELAHARVLGTLFARAWRATGRPLPDCLVPMPLHVSRYRERGFCQTTELARHISRRLRTPAGGPLPVRRALLQRVRATPAQSRLSADERTRNLRGAFACRPATAPLRHVALLDDVLTTGNTASAAMAALHQGGVERVELWCCAWSPRRSGPGSGTPPPGPAVPI